MQPIYLLKIFRTLLKSAYPPIDSKDIKLLLEETGSIQQADLIECNVISKKKIKKTKKNKPKSIHISDIKDLCKNNNEIPGTKKDIILPTKFSKDILDLFKRTNNNIEKIRVSGYVLIPPLSDFIT
ncbi:9649_t:CDS:2 [Dentiscutata heterogama]|uniref:9649_t:CDS:1 n=1 Tax=Dentiscutata heterogama TaxID=1316150 RepID=A0ACA9NF86_9GLOM|nr:9649_t:CDS:2 [Dentiscutata heterogama]